MVSKGFIFKTVFVLILAIGVSSYGWGQGTVTRPPSTPTNSQSNRPNKPSKPRRETSSGSSQRQTVSPQRSFSIRGLSFSNTDKNTNIINGYGEKLYSNDMRYLCFQAEYDGGSSSETKTIYIKVLNPDGSLKTGATSPSGYTTKTDITFLPGTNNKIFISGWGNETESTYSPGTYRVELYWDGKLQYQSSVRIYNSGITVKGVNFRNTDGDNNSINDYGSTLYSNNMRYLGYQLEYDGGPTRETKTIYVKIFKPDGSLMTGTSSPSGYTTSYERTFETGTNNKMYLGGWGNSTTSAYSPGLWKLEFYWDGKLQYQSSVRINSSDIAIKKINFRNSDKDNNVINGYGSTLYSDQMRYLDFQLEYDGTSSSQTKSVYLKIIKPDGTMMTGSSSPSGYTSVFSDRTFSSGSNNTMFLGGYGNNTSSSYPPGQYRIELYWDGKLQYQTNLRIASSGISVKGLNFRNSDIDNNVINGYGSTLYANQMRYLDIQAEYDGGTSRETKTVYVKVYSPSGILETNSSSPSGYTWKGDRTFETGNNHKVFIFGWGSNTKSLYNAGTYKIELYWDGKLQYQGNVRLY
ncbi:MAG: hypothetical protein J1E38_10220 [Paramuribaculum sp.]|nr:hypothetical protein [Paramuribaculum sp.]